VTSQSRENHTGGQWRLSVLHDAHAKCSPTEGLGTRLSPNLTADGLTSQVCSISLPGTHYM